MDSTTGKMRGTIQGSCRPGISKISICLFWKFNVFWAFLIEAVGLTAIGYVSTITDN